MFQRLERSLTRSARLVLDVREWFAGEFASGPALEVAAPGGGTDLVRAIVRPEQTLTVTATPTEPRNPRWPFSGPVELVTTRTQAGLLAFFGRVRAPGGGPLRRLLVEGTACNLRIEGPGYVAVSMIDVPIPGRDEPSRLEKVELLPASDYPFPTGTTVLLGGVFQPDGTPITGVIVSAPSVPDLKAAVTDADGLWALVLNRPDAAGVVASPVGLTLVAGGQTLAAPQVAFEAGRANRYPQTLLRGRVRTADGREVAGAKVAVAPFPGQSSSRVDGSWVFYLGVDRPLSGTQPATIQITPPGRPAPPPVSWVVKFGESNEVPPITA